GVIVVASTETPVYS
uniref:Uncharacterized protein n=1 Tax=Anopheles quadriannulatus TaxID=34691 RepID=A0A182XGZ1_ANOQN